jgi:hypothetical protein
MGIFTSPSCPVGCGHCAVSATPQDVPSQSALLAARVEQMSQTSSLVAVAITGGEPFFELDLLVSLAKILNSANKHVVVYSSGYWGRADILPCVDEVLENIDGIVFGMDLYHRAYIPDEDLICALRRTAGYGVWIAAQVVSGIDGDAHLVYAQRIFRDAFGADWENRVTIVPTPPLPRGRARKLKSFREYHPAPDEFCTSINGPTLLRDGTLAACCNEEAVLHKGPNSLRVEDRDGFNQTLEELKNRTVLAYIRAFPPSVLLSLAAEYLKLDDPVQPGWMCEACWSFLDLYERMGAQQQITFDRMVSLLMETQKRQRPHTAKAQEPFTTSNLVSDV